MSYDHDNAIRVRNLFRHARFGFSLEKRFLTPFPAPFPALSFPSRPRPPDHAHGHDQDPGTEEGGLGHGPSTQIGMGDEPFVHDFGSRAHDEFRHPEGEGGSQRVDAVARVKPVLERVPVEGVAHGSPGIGGLGPVPLDVLAQGGIRHSGVGDVEIGEPHRPAAIEALITTIEKGRQRSGKLRGDVG